MERGSIQQSEAFDTVGRLAHHLESDVTSHGEATQCKSVGRRREDRSGNPTHRVVSRGVCHDFTYDAEKDHYICPAGQTLTKGLARSDRKDDIDHYRHLTACFTCTLKPKCTPDKLKRLKRWRHEGVLDKMQARLERRPDAMLIRRQTVEHPFGTLKSWMGSAHFLTKTLEKVRTEMSLHVLAYNMKRMIRIFGVGPLLEAMRAYSHGSIGLPSTTRMSSRQNRWRKHRVFTRPRSWREEVAASISRQHRLKKRNS